MSDIKIVIGADITELNSKMAQAGGVTQAFATKSVTAVNTVGAATSKLGANIGSLKSVGSSAFSSLSSSIFSVISPANLALAGITALGAGIYKLSQSYFGATEAQQRLNDVLEGGKSAYIKAVQAIDNLKNAIQQAKEGVGSKEAAVKLYNKTLGEATGKVKTLDEAEIGLAANAANYIKYTFLKAAANKALEKSADALFKAEVEKQIGPRKRTILESIGGRGSGNTKEVLQQFRINEALKEANTFKEIYNSLLAQANGLGIKFNETLEVKEVKEKTSVKNLRTIQDVLKELEKSQKVIKESGDLIGTEETKANIDALKKAFTEMIRDFNTQANKKIILNIAFQINAANARLSIEEFKQRAILPELERQTGQAPAKLVVAVRPKFLLDQDLARDEAAKLAEQTASIIQGATVSALTGIGDAIGDAMAGGGNFFGSLFSAIFKALGAGIRQLGIYAIATSKAIVAIKATIGTTLGIAGGVALVVLGTLISAAASKISAPKFATGVRNFTGGVAMVGERGPELINLPRGSDVIPNNQVNASGGGGLTLMPSIEYSGSGFRIMLNRVDAQNRRNN